VLVPFPFSDLTRSKLRPAVVLARAGLNDFVMCQVTSNPYTDRLAIEIKDDDFAKGSLRRTSYARPGKLFTANSSLIVAQVGILGARRFQSILDAVVDLLRGVTTP
jgi:mRNA interferase MazF